MNRREFLQVSGALIAVPFGVTGFILAGNARDNYLNGTQELRKLKPEPVTIETTTPTALYNDPDLSFEMRRGIVPDMSVPVATPWQEDDYRARIRPYREEVHAGDLASGLKFKAEGITSGRAAEAIGILLWSAPDLDFYQISAEEIQKQIRPETGRLFSTAYENPWFVKVGDKPKILTKFFIPVTNARIVTAGS